MSASGLCPEVTMYPSTGSGLVAAVEEEGAQPREPGDFPCTMV